MGLRAVSSMWGGCRNFLMALLWPNRSVDE
jgi:hypothetical protein